MAPKKKLSSSSSSSRKAKPVCQQPPASKYGIQHFFERHSQSQAASNSSGPHLNLNSKLDPNSSLNAEPSLTVGKLFPVEPLQPVAVVDNEEKSSQSTPEHTKNVSHKRKLSPGFLIKQSQDDRGDEITWKISPLNEKLRPLTAKQLPRRMTNHSDPTRQGASFILPCMLKLEPGRSLKSITMQSVEQETEACHSNENTCVEPSSKDFQTPPSTSYNPSKLTAVEMGFGLNHKSFIELLNQVEDVVIDKAAPNSRLRHSVHRHRQNEKYCNLKEGNAVVKASQNVDSSLNDEVFLVLEVSEKHSTVDSSLVHKPCKVLRLLHERTGGERALYLYDEWFYSIIGPGDTVSVDAKFDEEGTCVVSHSNNVVIVFPDVLVPGTRVASSFGCPRRAILDERLKVKEYSSSALIGTMLHQIFQAGLLKDSPTSPFLEECAAIILQRNIENLYASGANQKSTLAQLVEEIPKILNWITCFKDQKGREKTVVDFGQNGGLKEVSIVEVMDIEEMAWSPKYGLKGVIDASLRIKRGSDIGDSIETFIPLEFKSGKGTTGQTAMEHCAQVILYTLLMSERYLQKDVDSGILYYLHTDETRGVKVVRPDLVGLIMRRNELASDIVRASSTQVLPPMLKNLNVCKSCRHLNSCSIYHKAYANNCETSGLGELYDKYTGHLSTTHIQFLKHWDHLIDLEAKTCQVASKKIFHARHLSENNSSGLFSLVLDATNGFFEDEFLIKGRYIYHFVPQRASHDNHEMVNADVKQLSEPQVGRLACSLKCGDIVEQVRQQKDQLYIGSYS